MKFIRFYRFYRSLGLDHMPSLRMAWRRVRHA